MCLWSDIKNPAKPALKTTCFLIRVTFRVYFHVVITVYKDLTLPVYKDHVLLVPGGLYVQVPPYLQKGTYELNKYFDRMFGISLKNCSWYILLVPRFCFLFLFIYFTSAGNARQQLK